jgi:hypothetical protein
MFEYAVNFYYETDLRKSWEGVALNEAHAIQNALMSFYESRWCDPEWPGFYIEIKLKNS